MCVAMGYAARISAQRTGVAEGCMRHLSALASRAAPGTEEAKILGLMAHNAGVVLQKAGKPGEAVAPLQIGCEHCTGVSEDQISNRHTLLAKCVQEANETAGSGGGGNGERPASVRGSGSASLVKGAADQVLKGAAVPVAMVVEFVRQTAKGRHSGWREQDWGGSMTGAVVAYIQREEGLQAPIRHRAGLVTLCEREVATCNAHGSLLEPLALGAIEALLDEVVLNQGGPGESPVARAHALLEWCRIRWGKLLREGLVAGREASAAVDDALCGEEGGGGTTTSEEEESAPNAGVGAEGVALETSTQGEPEVSPARRDLIRELLCDTDDEEEAGDAAGGSIEQAASGSVEDDDDDDGELLVEADEDSVEEEPSPESELEARCMEALAILEAADTTAQGEEQPHTVLATTATAHMWLALCGRTESAGERLEKSLAAWVGLAAGGEAGDGTSGALSKASRGSLEALASLLELHRLAAKRIEALDLLGRLDETAGPHRALGWTALSAEACLEAGWLEEAEEKYDALAAALSRGEEEEGEGSVEALTASMAGLAVQGRADASAEGGRETLTETLTARASGLIALAAWHSHRGELDACRATLAAAGEAVAHLTEAGVPERKILAARHATATALLAQRVAVVGGDPGHGGCYESVGMAKRMLRACGAASKTGGPEALAGLSLLVHGYSVAAEAHRGCGEVMHEIHYLNEAKNLTGRLRATQAGRHFEARLAQALAERGDAEESGRSLERLASTGLESKGRGVVEVSKEVCCEIEARAAQGDVEGAMGCIATLGGLLELWGVEAASADKPKTKGKGKANAKAKGAKGKRQAGLGTGEVKVSAGLGGVVQLMLHAAQGSLLRAQGDHAAGESLLRAAIENGESLVAGPESGTLDRLRVASLSQVRYHLARCLLSQCLEEATPTPTSSSAAGKGLVTPSAKPLTSPAEPPPATATASYKRSYKSLQVAPLRDLLKTRGLVTKGVKAVLVARLEEDDASKAELDAMVLDVEGLDSEEEEEKEKGEGAQHTAASVATAAGPSDDVEGRGRRLEALSHLTAAREVCLFQGSCPPLLRQVGLALASILAIETPEAEQVAYACHSVMGLTSRHKMRGILTEGVQAEAPTGKEDAKKKKAGAKGGKKAGKGRAALSESDPNLPSSTSRLKDAFAFDSSLWQAHQAWAEASQAALPPSWAVVCVCPGLSLAGAEGSKLLVTRLTRNGIQSGTVALPQDLKVPAAQAQLEGIVGQHVASMGKASGMDASGEGLAERKRWWEAREALDNDMAMLLARLDQTWLEPARELFTGPAQEDPEAPIILVLDQSVQGLPWESFSSLAGRAVTRVPSLSFVLGALARRSAQQGSPSPPQGGDAKGYYVINPKGDLRKTQESFEEYFKSRSDWDGVIGQPPPQEAYAAGLRERDLFVYCGHSAGEQFLRSDAVARLPRCASTLLMGCSSGRLRDCGAYEPFGMPVAYLQGGCESLVANLWDVTDKDIDRFAKEVLRQWIDEEEKEEAEPLSVAMQKARQVCRLKTLIGAAPVCYGVPAYVPQ